MVRWGTYANLLASGDGSDPENQGMLAKAYALQAQFMAATAFIKSEILALPEGQAAAWMAADPELAVYRPALEQVLIERPYKLHPQTEEALAALSEVSEAPFIIYERARSSDMTFEPITAPDGRTLPVSFSLYEDELELSADTAVRRAAFDSFTRGLKAYQNTLAATFATEVKKNIVLSRLRGYESVTHMLLAPHRIDHGVYHNLLDVIQSELAPHMRRYARLRKRVLGLDEMRYCDIEAPLDPGYNPQVTREEAANLILDALSVLGPEYRAIIERAFNERWIDWADNVGKQAGAFCTSPYGAHSYILLTFTGHMRSAFTLAHELGHAGHFELANRHQRLLNVEPSLFFVEAPSTMNEVLLADHILKGTDDKRMRRWVITQLLMTYHHNFVRHLLEAELQRRIYAQAEKGVPVTAQAALRDEGGHPGAVLGRRGG
ncbi:MAG: oligoendopeptidase F, partial [Symbiobacterium thermophilum]